VCSSDLASNRTGLIKRVELVIGKKALIFILNTSEAYIGTAAIIGMALSCRGSIIDAIVVRTEERAAFNHPLKCVRIVGVITLVHATVQGRGIPRDSLEADRVIPIFSNFPYVADHIIKTIAIGWEILNGRSAQKTVLPFVVVWEYTLKGIGHKASIRVQFISPSISLAGVPPSGGVFPLRLGWQSFPCPFRVSCGVFISNMNDGVIPPLFQIAFRPFWILPTSTVHPYPPGGNVVGRYCLRRGTEHQ